MARRKENWLPIPGYEDYYRISDLGRIWSIRYNQLMKPGDNGKGYFSLILFKDGVRDSRYVHELVLTTFDKPRPEGMEACHGPKGRADNSLANLEWNTPSINNGEHKRRDGTAVLGPRDHASKLTDVTAREAFERAKAGEKHCDLALEYGIGKTAMYRLTTGKSWKHLKLAA